VAILNGVSTRARFSLATRPMVGIELLGGEQDIVNAVNEGSLRRLLSFHAVSTPAFQEKLAIRGSSRLSKQKF
jgi:hypothetical protein